MRQLAIGFSLLALLLLAVAPARAEEGREGVPGRRVGGGTRWGYQSYGQAVLRNQPRVLSRKLSAMSLASRTRLPQELKLRALYS